MFEIKEYVRFVMLQWHDVVATLIFLFIVLIITFMCGMFFGVIVHYVHIKRNYMCTKKIGRMLKENSQQSY